MSNNQYSTLSEASADLRNRGYNTDFHVNENIELIDYSGHKFNTSEVMLKEFHRFEGITNPSDSTILYAVETKSGLKGTVIDSYGVYGSDVISEFMNKVEQNQY